MVPVECKLSLQRKNSKLSGEWDQDQFIQLLQSRDCEKSKSQNRQNVKPWIITTSKQGSSELWRQKSLELWSKNPQNFKAGSSALLRQGIIRTSKEGIARTLKEEIIRTFSANFEVIRKHVSSKLHNWTARGWSALPTSLKESFLKSITWVWGLHYLDTAAIFSIEEECLPWSNWWIAMLTTTTRLYTLFQLYTFASEFRLPTFASTLFRKKVPTAVSFNCKSTKSQFAGKEVIHL